MGCVALKYKASFELHIRCDNCMRETVKTLDVPNVDDAPTDPEDLIDSAFLQSIPYRCTTCQCQVGQLFKILLL